MNSAATFSVWRSDPVSIASSECGTEIIVKCISTRISESFHISGARDNKQCEHVKMKLTEECECPSGTFSRKEKKL